MKKKHIRYIVVLIFSSFYSFSFAQNMVDVTYYFKDDVGQKTSYGEIIKPNDLTIATAKYAHNTVLKLTNIKTLKSIEVRVVETLKEGVMPEYILSNYAASQIGAINKNFIPLKVKLEVVKKTDSKKESESETEDYYNYEEESDEITGLVQITEVKEDGWGVQLASYNKINGLLEALENIQESSNKTSILMYFDKDAAEGEAKYKLIAGPFKTKAHAEGYKEAMLDSFEDMLIVLFSDL